MRSYADHSHWKTYQAFFPQRARIQPGAEPHEEAWTWKGNTIHLDRYPCTDAPLKVLLLHGAGANGRIMGAFGTMLQRHGYAAVSPDLPGYGMSDVSPDAVCQPAWVQMVADLIDAERQRDDMPIVLFGASLGGMLAYQVACRHPGVAGVIATTLADPSEPSTGIALARTPWLARLGMPILQALRAVLDPIPVPIRWFSKMDQISNDPAMVRALLDDPTAAGSVVPVRFLRSLMTTAPDRPPEAFDTCPVLLVHPERDFMTPLEMSRRFFDRLSGDKTFVLLEGAGHMPLEQPGIDQLERAVFDFLGRLSPASA